MESNARLREEIQKMRQSLEALGQTVSTIVPKENKSRLSPFLSLIAKPVRGVNYNRSISVAAYLREKINFQNSDPNCSEMYIAFPEGHSDRQINPEAKRLLKGC